VNCWLVLTAATADPVVQQGDVVQVKADQRRVVITEGHALHAPARSRPCRP
jgi:hypothetical protein